MLSGENSHRLQVEVIHIHGACSFHSLQKIWKNNSNITFKRCGILVEIMRIQRDFSLKFQCSENFHGNVTLNPHVHQLKINTHS